MATMVAAQHEALWQRRPSQMMQISPMGVPAVIPNVPNHEHQPPQRPYQQSLPIQLPMTMAPPQNASHHMMPYQQAAYGFDLTNMTHYAVQPPFMNYTQSIQQTPTYTTAPTDLTVNIPHTSEARNALSNVSRSPTVKAEDASPIEATHYFIPQGSYDHSNDSSSSENAGPAFSTEVDCLMRAIQAKQPEQNQAPRQMQHMPIERIESTHVPTTDYASKPQSPVEVRTKARKRYLCSIPNCNKSFYQKTHLEIHTRAHTGVKPFLCKEPSCGQRFSQLGNLKTHERRHTGERPYTCDICGKKFAQRGNVRAHKIVHQQIKPFTCRLDDCGKQFTQLGNLKSHQNKFHADTLRYLTTKFSTPQDANSVTQHDRELWEYFARLYKNSNKGIKGRGKDRRISTVGSGSPPAEHHQQQSHITGDTTLEGEQSHVSMPTASAPMVVPDSHPMSATGSMHHSRSSRSSSFGSADHGLVQQQQQQQPQPSQYLHQDQHQPMQHHQHQHQHSHQLHQQPQHMPPQPVQQQHPAHQHHHHDVVRPAQQFAPYDDTTGYSNMVFPERKMF